MLTWRVSFSVYGWEALYATRIEAELVENHCSLQAPRQVARGAVFEKCTVLVHCTLLRFNFIIMVRRFAQPDIYKKWTNIVIIVVVCIDL